MSDDDAPAAVEVATRGVFDQHPLPGPSGSSLEPAEAASSNDDALAAVEAATPEASGSTPPQALNAAQGAAEDDSNIDPRLLFPPSAPPVPPPPRNPLPPPSLPVNNEPAPEEPPNDPLDLITGIKGVQISKDAPTVTWSSGQKTVLPFLEGRDKRRRKFNLLQQEARYVKDMAGLPECNESSDFVVFLDRNMPRPELLNAAREALSLNKAVVIRGFLEDTGFDLTMEGLTKEFNTLPGHPIGVHGMYSLVYIT